MIRRVASLTREQKTHPTSFVNFVEHRDFELCFANILPPEMFVNGFGIQEF